MKTKHTDARVANRQHAHSNSFIQRWWNIQRAVPLALVAALLPACVSAQREATVPTTTTPPVVSTSPTANTSVSEVAENTNQLIGQTVTVRGEVEEIVGANAFRIDDDKIFGGEEVLVVNAIPEAVPITEGKEVRVTGTVRKFVLVDFERDYDLTWDLDLKRKVEAEYEGKPVIVAQTTQVVE